MHDWFCEIDLIESIYQKKAELMESSNVSILMQMETHMQTWIWCEWAFRFTMSSFSYPEILIMNVLTQTLKSAHTSLKVIVPLTYAGYPSPDIVTEF